MPEVSPSYSAKRQSNNCIHCLQLIQLLQAYHSLCGALSDSNPAKICADGSLQDQAKGIGLIARCALTTLWLGLADRTLHVQW